MKVISFHSYKGGRGRTTAIASLANLYARTGKHVALLDVDVTAPWLHTRYDVSTETLESQGWLGSLIKGLTESSSPPAPTADLDKYSIRLDDLPQGSVRLFAPGNPETAEYWNWMAEEFPRFLGVRSDPHILRLWRRLRNLISNASPRPDVLLVDSPAGYHQASAFVAMAIADSAVLFTQSDHADAQWTTQMVRMIREARPTPARKRYGELRVIGVRARYPDYIFADFDSDDRFLNFQERYVDAEFDGWVSLESDPRLELASSIPIGLTGPIRQTKLVDGYAELLGVALGHGPSYGAELLERLPADQVTPGERPQFFLLEEQGILTNPADRARNVSFRVETFCGLLDDLHAELIEGRMDGSSEDASLSPSLAVAGRAPGSRFGSSLAQQLERLRPTLDDEDRLRRWCEFDSRVGFGGLELKHIDKTTEGDAVRGAIAVHGNFLAVDRPDDDETPDLCMLLTGYIEGVLSMLLRNVPSGVKVCHPPNLCIREGEKRSSCEFNFAVAGRGVATET